MRSVRQFLTGCFLVFTACTLQATEQSPSGNALLGCWQHDKEATTYYRFEAARWITSEAGRLNVLSIKYLPGKIIADGTTELQFEVKGRALTLTLGKQVQTFHRIEALPDEYDLKPLALGLSKPLGAERVGLLKVELLKRREEDQAVRTNPARSGDGEKVDTANTEYLIKLVKEVGWIDVGRFGQEVSTAAFLIVQHSGHLKLMLAALPEIEKDVRSKHGDPQDFALLYDRLKLRLGEKQRYGTQIGNDEKGLPIVFPLEDKAKVEEFRRELGLFPLAQYLAMYKKMTGAKEIRFQEE